MTTLLRDPAQEERVLEISEDWERSGVSPRLVLLIGVKDYSDRIVSGEWGQAEGPAISATINLSGNLPQRLENAPITLSVDVGGITIPQLVGHRSRAEQGQERNNTSLVAASLGSLLGKATFDITPDVNGRRLLEFRGASPEYVVWNMLARLPYDLSRVSVEPVGNPLLTFAGSESGFKAEQHPTDVLGRVLESVAYQLSDTPYGGHEARLAPDLANVEEIITIYDADEIKWTPPSLVDELYTQVEVFRYNPDGSDAFPPVRVDVPYVGLEYELVRGQTLSIPFADESANAHAFARQHARNMAFNLARGYRKGETTLPFAPLMRKGDAFGVREVREDDDGTWERSWICMVDSYKHPFTNFLETTVSYTASLVREELIRRPRIVVSGVSAGVIQTPAAYELAGDDLYFGAGLRWVSLQGDDAIFYTDPLLMVSGDDLVVSQ